MDLRLTNGISKPLAKLNLARGIKLISVLVLHVLIEIVLVCANFSKNTAYQFYMGFEGHTRGMWNYGFLTLSLLARGTDILVSGLGRLYPTWI